MEGGRWEVGGGGGRRWEVKSRRWGWEVGGWGVGGGRWEVGGRRWGGERELNNDQHLIANSQ